MKRAIVVLSLGSAVAAAAFLASHAWIRPDRPAAIREEVSGLPEQTRLPSSTNTSDEPVPQLSGGAEHRMLAQPRGLSVNVADHSSRALESAKRPENSPLFFPTWTE